MWMHGFEDFAAQGNASEPDLRRYLVDHGFAWAGSSYSSTGFIPDRGADETAALWDLFVSTVGRPSWTYGLGLSMGGWSGALVAERYADRFDGVLAMCGASGTTMGLGTPAAQFVAGAYATSVTQAEIDRAVSIGDLVDEQIRPTLRADDEARATFEQLLVELTGGPRPFDVEGLRTTEEVNWRRAQIMLDARVVPPHDWTADLRADALLDRDRLLDELVVPPFDPDTYDEVFGGMRTTGALRVPVVTMHTTGDGQTPIIEAVLQRALVDAAGAAHMLVQRVFRDQGHCAFSAAEQEAAFDALVAWVEHGDRPEGTDLSTGDLRNVDGRFEQPRHSTTISSGVQLDGRATIDGTSLNASWIGAVVIGDGLVTPCNDGLPSVVNGRFHLNVFDDAEVRGCAATGRRIALWTYVDDVRLFSDAVQIDSTVGTSILVEFRTDDPTGDVPATTEFYGDALTTTGEHQPAGVRIDAIIDGTACGVTSTRGDGTFILAVVGPDSRPGCHANGSITFTLGGTATGVTAPNGVPRRDPVTLRPEP
jgi:pimeloyl-ACP methyl ester carboxylesterase